MSRRPEDAPTSWKAGAILAGAAIVGLGIVVSFDGRAATVGTAGPSGTDAPKTEKTTKTTSTAAPIQTTTTVPLKPPADIKVLVANATATTGATAKVTAALKPACYQLPKSIDATAKVKTENRPSTSVYSTPGYEREAALIRNLLQLPTGADTALPEPPPIAKTGVPSYNVLVLVGKDLVDTPPQPVPLGASCSTAADSTSSTKKGTATTKPGTATTKAGSATTVKPTTTTTKKPTTTTKLVTTTTTA